MASNSGRDFVLEVIEMYRDHPCLWQVVHADYHDKLKRNKALDDFLPLFKRVDNNSNRETVQKKLASIRSAFNKELRKVGYRINDVEKKEAAWEAIAEEFNASATTSRSVEALKLFYKNKKQETRKYARENRASLTATGRGPGTPWMGDLVLDLTLELMIKKTVHNHFHLQARTSNFTFEEKMILISIIQKYKEVIENKATGSMMWKKRKLHGRPLQRNLMPAQLRHDQWRH
nr:unnamed protein product [Callosobruchus chinensis]